MPWAVRSKWNWYFRYRHALLQVQYPQFKVESTWGNYEVKQEHIVHLQSIKNRIVAKRRKITEINNKLEKARKHWDELFPIETNPLYHKAIKKLDRIKQELIELEQAQ